MASKDKPRMEPADETAEMTFISLMLLLLCFMVIMVSLAQLEGPRFRSAIGSVRGAFSLLRDASSTSMVSNGGPGVLSARRTDVEADVERLKNVLRALLGEEAEGLVNIDVTDPGVSLTLGSLVLFDPGSARLKGDAAAILAEVARFLSDWPGEIVIVGFTDDLPIHTAAFPSNWDLSMARAVEIVRYFGSAGIENPRMIAEGDAAAHPIVPNDSAENRAQNRRVEIRLEYFAKPAPGESAGAAGDEEWFTPAGQADTRAFEVPGEEWTRPVRP